MVSSDLVVSRRDTTLVKTKALVGQLRLDFEPGRRGWVHRALDLRIAESRRDRHLAADIVKRRHYLAPGWPCKPKRFILSYLADLGTGDVAGLAMIVLQPGQYRASKALNVQQYETLSLVRVWRADDLGPSVAPDFAPLMLRRIVRRLRQDWCTLKLQAKGLRAPPLLLVTHADPARGHDGALYSGAGATYCGVGTGGKREFAWALEATLQEPLRSFGRMVLAQERLQALE